MSSMAGDVGFFLVILLLILPLAQSESPKLESQRLVVGEYLVLAQDSLSKGDVDRAIFHLERASAHLDDDDPRQKAIKERIADAKAMQMRAANQQVDGIGTNRAEPSP